MKRKNIVVCCYQLHVVCVNEYVDTVTIYKQIHTFLLCGVAFYLYHNVTQQLKFLGMNKIKL